MVSFYHGSRIRYVIDGAVLRLRHMINEARQRSTQAGRSDDPKLARNLAAYEDSVARRDWATCHKIVLSIVESATARRDAALLTEMGQALERLGDNGRSADVRLTAHQLKKGSETRDWSCADITGKRLLIRLIEDNPRSLGKVIRYARLVGPAARRAKQTAVVVEPRLVPLMKRTFPDIVVQPSDNSFPETDADVVVTFEHLAVLFATVAETLAANFKPLLVDPLLATEFRSRYRSMTSGPLVGLSWGSKSHTKDVPSFSEWARFIAQTPATFVSLQYGRINGALRRLRHEGGRGRVIHDPTVDQLVDMDRFAAQIASLDAVVTISNTGAHLAGALGVPAIFLIDDKFHTAWPVVGDRTPWYPTGVVVRRDRRTWPQVLDEVECHLSDMLAARSAGACCEPATAGRAT